METIPLRSLFDNEDFQNSGNAVQLGCLKAIYYLSVRKQLMIDYTSKLRFYTELQNETYYRHRRVIMDILEDVIPKIIKQKRVKVRALDIARKAYLSNVAKRHIAQAAGKLAEPILENPAPLMPQLSAVSESLRKERIVSEQHFTTPLPIRNKQHAQPVKPPSLKEKPTTS